MMSSQDDIKKAYSEMLMKNMDAYIDSVNDPDQKKVAKELVEKVKEANKAMFTPPTDIPLTGESTSYAESLPPQNQGLGSGMGIMGDCCPPLGDNSTMMGLIKEILPHMVPVIGDKIINKFKVEPGVIHIKYKTNDVRMVNQSEFDVKIGDPQMMPVITQIIQTFKEHAEAELKRAEEFRKQNIEDFLSKQKKKYKKKAKNGVSNPDTVPEKDPEVNLVFPGHPDHPSTKNSGIQEA
jgi:hypothetical protein